MHVSILTVEGAFDSGLSAVQDILGAANVLRGEVANPVPAWEVSVVGMRRYVTTGNGHRVTTARPEELDWPPDVLVMPALGLRPVATLIELVRSPSLGRAVEFVAETHHGGAQLASACSGALLLAQAGVLDGQDATTSWWLGPAFRAQYPSVRLDTSATLVVGDRVTTAGAAFAHIDLALSLIHQRSPALADVVARYLLLGDRASQANYAIPAMLARHSPDLAAFETWVRAHLETTIRVGDAAAAIGVSERTLQRVTSTTVGISPIEFINEIRIDQALHLFKITTLTTSAVAKKVGFQNPATLRTLLRQRRGMTLRQVNADRA